MTIGFSGHRDRWVDVRLLEALLLEFPDAVWAHGCAEDGFDKQVDDFARTHRIGVLPFPPDKSQGVPACYHIRNRQIVHACSLLVVCWDGRKQGGTFSTMRYAETSRVPVRYWHPVEK